LDEFLDYSGWKPDSPYMRSPSLVELFRLEAFVMMSATQPSYLLKINSYKALVPHNLSSLQEVYLPLLFQTIHAFHTSLWLKIIEEKQEK
jgi:hypothetical protein